MSTLRDLLDRTPAWLRIFNRKYQLKTVHRMNALLREMGLSQKDLAARAGWTEGYVSRILSGRENLTLKTLARFEAAVGAEVLQVSGEEPAATWLVTHVAAPACPAERSGRSCPYRTVSPESYVAEIPAGAYTTLSELLDA